jgi:hypothetical protein
MRNAVKKFYWYHTPNCTASIECSPGLRLNSAKMHEEENDVQSSTVLWTQQPPKSLWTLLSHLQKTEMNYFGTERLNRKGIPADQRCRTVKEKSGHSSKNQG